MSSSQMKDDIMVLISAQDQLFASSVSILQCVQKLTIGL